MYRHISDPRSWQYGMCVVMWSNRRALACIRSQILTVWDVCCHVIQQTCISLYQIPDPVSMGCVLWCDPTDMHWVWDVCCDVIQQTCIAWEAPALHENSRLRGYQIQVDGKPLGGLRNPDIEQMVINNLVPGAVLHFLSLLFCSILFCSILFCSILFYSVLFYSVLFYSVLFCSVLFYSVLFCSILFCYILFYSVLFYSALFCSVLFYSILFYSVLFYSILFCSILFYSILFCSILFCSILFCSVLFCSVLFYSVLFCSVLFCSVLFCSILFCSVLFYSILFYPIPFCTVLFYSILFYSILGCVLRLQEVALHQSPPAFSVLCYPCPYRSLLPHNVISSMMFWSSTWSYALNLPLCASNSPSVIFHSGDVSSPFPFRIGYILNYVTLVLCLMKVLWILSFSVIWSIFLSLSLYKIHFGFSLCLQFQSFILISLSVKQKFLISMYAGTHSYTSTLAYFLLTSVCLHMLFCVDEHK